MAMNMETGPEREPSISEAAAEVQAAREMAMVKGANDYEMSAFDRLLQQLLDREITPKEAVAQAGAIVDSKQDYH